jgi:undecaprenyl-diphosphatase
VRRLFCCLAAAALLFALVARLVMTGETMQLDTSLRDAVHGWASPALTVLMRAFTTLGAGFFLLAMGAILIGYLVTTGGRRRAVLLATVTLSAELLLQVLKLAFHRLRPAVFFGLSPAETYSFPSGHAFVATVFCALVAAGFMAGQTSRAKRHAIAAMAILVSLAIGFSRVYLGYHYPSDVVGGWLLAVAWLTLAKLTLVGCSG